MQSTADEGARGITDATALMLTKVQKNPMSSLLIDLPTDLLPAIYCIGAQRGHAN